MCYNGRKKTTAHKVGWLYADEKKSIPQRPSLGWIFYFIEKSSFNKWRTNGQTFFSVAKREA